MQGILPDVNAEDIVTNLRFVWRSAPWRELWFGLDLSIESLQTLHLAPDAPDQLIWRTCQEQRLVLITANRNPEGPETLDAVIQEENRPDCLPVMTLADPRRIQSDRAYAERTAERMLEYLLRIDEVRGVGRLYVP
jgi:hypothetical protein